jgi:hypothetical protein
LVAGAAAGVRKAATAADHDAYAKLKWLLERRLAGNASAEFILAEHELDLDSQIWEAPLRQALIAAGADTDPEVLAAAVDLLEIVDPSGAAKGKYTIYVGDSQGVQIGDHNSQTNTFDTEGPPGPDFPSEP